VLIGKSNVWYDDDTLYTQLVGELVGNILIDGDIELVIDGGFDNM